MLCPKCQVSLHMAVRRDVEIDYCPNCRGVWLDRGELDKIIERSIDILEPKREKSEDRDHEKRKKRKKSRKKERLKDWLEELFD
ncbi:MAG: zf-TFIIB domain-containing protein [Pseudomonadota bacterium]